MTAPQHQAWNRPREGPPLPCHPSRCPACGDIISIEVHAGVTRDYCHGCERNRARADMGLPALDYTAPVTYEEAPRHNGPRVGQPVRTKPKDPSAPRATRITQTKAYRQALHTRVIEKLPKYKHTACTTREIGASLGLYFKAAADVLHALKAQGRAESYLDYHRRGGKTLLWYRKAA
jgi:hypothetical protein